MITRYPPFVVLSPASESVCSARSLTLGSCPLFDALWKSAASLFHSFAAVAFPFDSAVFTGLVRLVEICSVSC